MSYPDILVTSSNASVATVAQADGVWTVTGVGRGYASIYVSADNGRVNRTLSVRVLDYDNPVTVSLSAIGDVMLGGDPRKSSYSRFETLWKNNGADYFFKKIESKLDDTDIAVANLEIPLINTARVVSGSRGYIFRGNTKYAAALAAGGIDAVDLDNNHILDYGSTGYSSTKTALKGAGRRAIRAGQRLLPHEKRGQDRLRGLPAGDHLADEAEVQRQVAQAAVRHPGGLVPLGHSVQIRPDRSADRLRARVGDRRARIWCWAITPTCSAASSCTVASTSSTAWAPSCPPWSAPMTSTA